LLTALWAICVAVWLAAAVVLVRDRLATMKIAGRMRGRNPTQLVAQLHAARSDIKRTTAAVSQLMPLGRRAALVALSLAHAFGSYRSFALRFRSFFG